MFPDTIRNNVSIVGSQVASALRGSQAGLLKACDSNVRGPINGLAVFCGIRAEEQTKVLGHKAVVVVVKELVEDRKSTRLNSSHRTISYAVFCLKKKIPSSRSITRVY